MLRDEFRAECYFGRCLFVLDLYFLVIPLLEEWQKESGQHPELIHIVTRAKKNCTAYERSEKYKGRGRRPVKGTPVHLQELFHSCASSFQIIKLPMYEKDKKVRFLSCIYLWGRSSTSSCSLSLWNIKQNKLF